MGNDNIIKKLVRKYKSLSPEVKASTAYTLSSVLQKGLSLITLPLFTRLLTTGQYGQLTDYSSWSGVLTIFITLNLAYGTFQTAMVKYKESREQYTSSISLMFCVLGCVFMTMYLPLQTLWNKLFKLPTFIIVIMTIEIVFNGITDCWMAKNRFEYKYISVVAVTVAKTVLSPLLAWILVISFTERGYARILGYAIINILFGIVLYVLIISKGKTFISKEYWKFALSFNIPLIPYYISQMIFNISDRIMISHIKGSDQAAIYGVAYSLAIMLNFLVTAINGSYSPWFLMQLDSGQGEKNKKVSLNLSIIIAVGLWLIVTMAPEVILVMAGKEYASGMWAVPPVAVSVLLLFYTGLFDRVLFLYEKKYLLVLCGAIPCVVNVALNYIFIPIYGFVAAAYTTLISYVLFATISYLATRKVLREKNKTTSLYNLKGLIMLFIVMCIMSGAVMVLYKYLFIRIGILVVAFVIMIIKRKTIIDIIKLRN